MPRSSINEFASEVARTIRNCCRNKANRRDVDKLVKAAALIVRQKLWGRLYAAARARDVSVEQEAISIIGDIFAGPDGDMRLCRVLGDDLEADDISLFLGFQAKTVRLASQELFHCWSELDPQSAKLWRNLKSALKKDPRLTVFPYNKPEWVTLKKGKIEKAEIHPLQYGAVKSLFAEEPGEKIPIGRRVAEALADFKTGAGMAAIKIEDLFRILRETAAVYTEAEAEAAMMTPDEIPLLKIALERATVAASKAIKLSLQKYRDKGKFAPDRCEQLSEALREIIRDCADGGPAISYFEYVRRQITDIDIGRYRSEYRTRFEYLAEQAQEEFYAVLRKELGS